MELMGKWMEKDGDFMVFFSYPFSFPSYPRKRKIRGISFYFLIFSLNYLFNLARIIMGKDGDQDGSFKGSALFTKWSSAEDNGNCQGHYEERKRALCGTENVCHTRLYILIFSWDFRGCQTLPFLRGQTMPRFPKNRGCHRVNSNILQRANPLILSPFPLFLFSEL